MESSKDEANDDEEERDPDRDPPEPFQTWGEWERAKSSEDSQDMRNYARSMV